MVAAGASWPRVLAFLVLCRVVVDGSLVFPSASPDSPLARLSVSAAAVTSFTGPQPEDASNVRNGTVVLFSGDVCHPIPMRAPGSIIVITSESASDTACSFESIYLALYATGAAAAIWPAVDNVPSYYLYSNDGSRGARTRHLPMLFLRIGPSNDVYTTLLTYAPEQNATVSPDVNVWKATLESWYYQLFIRILPGTALMGLGCTAIVYFAFHMRIIDDAYKSAVPEERRSLARRSEHFRHSFGLPHAVLAIEMCTATVSGIVVAIDGLHSTPNLPFPVVEFFMTLLSGWSFAASLLSASVWTKQVLELIESKTFLTRIIRGDYPTVFIVLVVVPIAVDTSISAVWSTYYYSDTLTGIAAVILFLFQLTLGLHVLGSVLRYYRFVSEVQSQTVSAAGRAQGMDALLARLSRCALGMSLSTMMVCFGTALSAASIKFLNSPTGWTVCFAFAYAGRALDTGFRVAMFKPRSTRRQAITMRAVEIVPKTGEFVLLRGSTHPGSAQGASASGLRNSTNPQQ